MSATVLTFKTDRVEMLILDTLEYADTADAEGQVWRTCYRMTGPAAPVLLTRTLLPPATLSQDARAALAPVRAKIEAKLAEVATREPT